MGNYRENSKNKSCNKTSNKTSKKSLKKIVPAKTTYQYRQLNYLQLPDSTHTILHRRAHFVSIMTFVISIFVEGFFLEDTFTFVCRLL